MVTAAHLNTDIRDNFAQTAPGLVTTDGDIVVATAANALKRLGAMGGGDTFLHEVGGLESDVSAGDGYVEVKGGSTTVRKSNLAAGAAPTVNDDVDVGYSVGSVWVDTTNDKAYVCLDATDGAAVWTETTSGFTAATQAQMEAAADNTVSVTPGRAHFHPGAAKVWVDLVLSTGTPTAAASYNLTSVGDGGVGESDLTFNTDFSSANYACVGMGVASGVNIPLWAGKLAGTITIQSWGHGGGALQDEEAGVAFFGDQA